MTFKSDCCGAPVTIGGTGETEGSTHWHVCTKCWKACDRVTVGLKHDDRPARGWWAPGGYMNTCRKCGVAFVGDKRAGHCADCAYGTPAHECKEDKTCSCSLQALEPDEECPAHGAGPWPPRCGVCGGFVVRADRHMEGAD